MSNLDIYHYRAWSYDATTGGKIITGIEEEIVVDAGSHPSVAQLQAVERSAEHLEDENAKSIRVEYVRRGRMPSPEPDALPC